jgi:hypothetical protein
MTPFLPFIFLGIAFVYSMGGFAGGSSYVLALTAAGVPQASVPATSLLCNVLVSSLVFINFRAVGHFKSRLALPFVIGSIPAAYLGARMHVPKEAFALVLCFSLVAASLRIFFARREFHGSRLPETGRLWATAFPLGALMGFLSGLIGIGGGIFLWPSLLLLGWADAREASAAASLFILVNSLSGLAGQLQKGFVPVESVALLVLFACAGGLMGSSLGSRKMAPLHLQRVFAALVCALSVQLLRSVL